MGQMTASICGGIYARVYCILYCVYDIIVGKTTESDRQATNPKLYSWRSNTVVLARCKESSRSLSHLLMSFLYNLSHATCYSYGTDNKLAHTNTPNNQIHDTSKYVDMGNRHWKLYSSWQNTHNSINLYSHSYTSS